MNLFQKSCCRFLFILKFCILLIMKKIDYIRSFIELIIKKFQKYLIFDSILMIKMKFIIYSIVNPNFSNIKRKQCNCNI